MGGLGRLSNFNFILEQLKEKKKFTFEVHFCYL